MITNLRTGLAIAAGNKFGEIDLRTAQAAHNSAVPIETLERALRFVETNDSPNILLLQCAGQVEERHFNAITFFPSVWSTSYSRFGTPYGRVHRDFHYQCIFLALSTLVEVGCTNNQIGNPMPGYLWRRDAYLCLLEAHRNIQKQMNFQAALRIEPGSYYPPMVKLMDERRDEFDMQEHRPVGVNMYIMDGFNMRRVFVEKQFSKLV